MGQYVDGFVIPISRGKLAKYKAMARRAAKIWIELGALEYVECIGDDLVSTQFGAPFPKMAGLKKGETLAFSWIVYSSKAARDRTNARVMKDPRVADMCDPKNLPFDMKRMAMGGFKVMVRR